MPPIGLIFQFAWKFKEEILGALLIIFLWWAWDHRYDQGYNQAKIDIVAASAKEANDIRGKENEISSHHPNDATTIKRLRSHTF